MVSGQPAPKWYQSPDGGPQHPRYWMNLTAAGVCLLWAAAVAARVLPTVWDGPQLPLPLVLVLTVYLPLVVTVVFTILSRRPADQPVGLHHLLRVMTALAVTAILVTQHWIGLVLAVPVIVLLWRAPKATTHRGYSG